jgi:DNA-binding MarR family transcriptional regulator
MPRKPKNEPRQSGQDIFNKDPRRVLVSELLRSADLLTRSAELFFRFNHTLTRTQFNVLDIVVKAGDDGIRCSDIGARMVTRDPDITRLLQRLSDRGWIRRKPSKEDKRATLAFATKKGVEVAMKFAQPERNAYELILEKLSDEQVEALNKMLPLIQAPYASVNPEEMNEEGEGEAASKSKRKRGRAKKTEAAQN